MLKKITIITICCGLLACQSGQQTPAPQTEAQANAASQSAAINDQLYKQALQSTKDGDIDKAIDLFKQIIQSEPTKKRAYTNLGLLYIHKKENEKAMVAFLNAIEVDKEDAVAYNHLAIIQRQQGEFKQALFNYYKAIKANPDYAIAHLNLGILLDIYLQDLPKALEQYEIYQKLTQNKDEKVDKWIIDIKRRIDASSAKDSK